MSHDSYNEIFFMVDTCQAGSLSNAIVSPNVVTIGSSQTGESSYAHHSDEEVRSALVSRERERGDSHTYQEALTLACPCRFASLQLGIAVIDRFTYATLDYLQRMKVGDWIRDASLRDLFRFYDPRMLFSTPDYRADILGRPIDSVPLTDFFGSVLDIQLHYDDEAYPLESDDDIDSDATIADDVLQAGNSSDPTRVRPPRRFGFSADFFLVGGAFIVGLAVVTHKQL